MRVVCDNCGATYKIPESKLTKEVNKATCRKCGHRMLIRRATPAAAPAPVPAVAENDGEHTQIRKAPSPADEWADDGPTRVARPEEDDNDRPTVATSPPPPVAEPPRPTLPAAAAPPPARPAPVVPSAPPAPAPAPTAPTASTAVPAAPRTGAFDPRGDLTWAALGGVISMAGALALAVNIADSAFLRNTGLALVLSGSLMSLFILLTGGRGVQKASVGASVVIAAVLGIGASLGINTVFSNLDGMNTSIEQAAARAPAPAPVAAEPTPEDDDVLAALAEPGGLSDDTDSAPAEVAPEPEPPAAVVAAAPRPAPTPAPMRGSGTDVAPPAPRPEPAPARVAPAAAPEPEPAPKPKASMNRLPTSVVETMIRNNKRIKRCWMEEKQRSGELPKRVDVKFTVEPSGSVSSARSATAKYRGTDFEVCLGSAFRSITFPPFEGDPLSMTYNFAL